MSPAPEPAATSSSADAAVKPFVPPEVTLPELTVLPVLLGTVLGIIFAFSSVYLGLKVGLTVSASIPVAVLSITVFRWMSKAFRIRQATILENNIAQTAGSAGESLAAGVAFTLPSLLLMGFEMEFLRILLVALLGGLIGVLMMIPLRHGLIVKEHGKLTFPEGTACADVLIVGEQGGTNAKTVFLGFFVGAIYAALNLIAKLWNDTATFSADFWGKLKGARVAFDVSPPMLGVGYIIGPKIAANMLAGGLLAFVILVPLIHLFGDAMPVPMYPEGHLRIAEMDAYQIHSAYVLYIGAGAVATGGFVSLLRALPSIGSAFASGLRDLQSRGSAPKTGRLRTERDLSLTTVVGGSIAIAVVIWLSPILEINLVSAILIVLFGFFFVTVSSRITGEIGSSANPISGMTVAALLLTCGLFVLVGWTGVSYKAMALTTAALVCVAASNGGTISQDLKTGHLVGATPRAQQISILIAVVASSLVIGWTLIILNQGHTTYRPVEFPDYTAQWDSAGPTMRGPDRNLYHVHFVREDVGQVPRGKYLVDERGKLQFLVDPGVAGNFPYRLESASYPGLIVPVSPNAPKELGNDHRKYSVAEVVDQPGLKPGRYLVNDSGEIAYAATDLWKFGAPKAQLFRLVIDGSLGGRLPWGLVLIGVFLSIMMELVGVSSLPFAVGLYLPIETSAGVFIGGFVRWLADRRQKDRSAAEAEFSPGVLMASGLIAGGSITGVVQSLITLREAESRFDLSEFLGFLSKNPDWWPMAWCLGLAGLLYWVGTRGSTPDRASGKAISS